MHIKRSENLILVDDILLFDTLTTTQQSSILFDIETLNIQILYTDTEIINIITNTKIQKIEDDISKFLDAKANEKGYDNIITASLRAALPNSPFYQEGLKYAEWMDSVWAYCYQELNKIKLGIRTEPTIEEFLLELPSLVL